MARTHADLTERIRIIRRLDFIEPARIKDAYDEHDKILGALLARRAGDASQSTGTFLVPKRPSTRCAIHGPRSNA